MIQDVVQLRISDGTMKRRVFLQACGSLCLLPSLSRGQTAAETKQQTEQAAYLKEVRKLSIRVGADKPFSALHIADSHLTRVDARENERKLKLSVSRSPYFVQAEAYF